MVEGLRVRGEREVGAATAAAPKASRLPHHSHFGDTHTHTHMHMHMHDRHRK